MRRVTCECGWQHRVHGGVQIENVTCRCGRTIAIEREQNAWNILHSRYAAAIKSGEWSETVERHWLTTNFRQLVPCGTCGSNWLTVEPLIDLSTPEAAFDSAWQVHNRVSTTHVQPPLPFMPYDQCRALWFGPTVAFIAVNYASHGGTETFHQTLLPELRHLRNVVGFGAIHGGGNPALLKVPYVEGRDAITRLCTRADIIVTWGIDALTSLLPDKRPKVIAVHHGDLAAGWIGETMWQTGIDEFVCVNKAAADHIRTVRDLPVHWVPNAIDKRRIKPTGLLESIRASVPEGAKVVLWGHRFSEEKRPELAIEMAKHLPSDWLLVMAGDGPLRPSSWAENVRWVGHVETLADWLAVADVFVSMSTFEGFGLSMAESAAAGVPIVATPVGIGPQVATELLSIEAGADEWARAVLSAVGRPRADCPKFDVESHVRLWAEILR